MTLEEWTESIVSELRQAGFDVEVYQGFPLAKPNVEDTLEGHQERVRLLKFRTTLASDRRLYSEGLLYLPAGADLIAKN